MKRLFTHTATVIATWVGSPYALIIAILVVGLSLALLGVDITNIGISIATMALAFIIQATQNRDSAALHAKLDGLIEAFDDADDTLERVEDLTEDEIEERRPNR